MKNMKLFLSVIGAYFAFSGVFHFIRLALEWDLIIHRAGGPYNVHSIFSAISILFATGIIYWSYKMKRSEKSAVKVTKNGERDGKTLTEDRE